MLQQVQASANFTSLMLGDFLNTEDSEKVWPSNYGHDRSHE